MTETKPIRRAHTILIWDSDWQYCQEKGIKGGFCFRKGVEFLQKRDESCVDVEKLQQTIAFLNGQIVEKADEIEQLKAVLEKRSISIV